MVVLKNGINTPLVLIAKPVPWSFKGQYFQNYHSVRGQKGQGNQGIVRRAFALAAISAYGTTGKTPYKGKDMPSVAVKVAAAVASNGQVQALKTTTRANRQAAREASHQAHQAQWAGMATTAAF